MILILSHATMIYLILMIIYNSMENLISNLHLIVIKMIIAS